jgi:hypothetical protein
MPDETRSVRNLRDDICYAHDQLRRAREDGGCERITFWLKRRDELLERFSAARKEQPVA